ncbi:MAG TPA: nicotinate-nucleotide adenylyltransferase [Acidimicrobiales bacterium]|nr:nicotinate-nucleotide adenylyltransferase [Acidimicrobiales bacterium]
MSETSGQQPVRIGIFGGTFDPVHVGHLVAAVNVRHDLALDRLLLVVANNPWQKVGERDVTPAEERFALVAAAVTGCEGLEASRLEIDRGGDSYTADTVAELETLYPGCELYLVIGADVADELDTWERVDELRDRVRLVVVNRPGSRQIQIGPSGLVAGFRTSVVEVPALEISSTDLRDRAATGRPLDFLVPSEAIREMRDRSLYVGGA